MTWALKHIAHSDPITIQTRLQEELLQKCKCFHTRPLLPELRWQSLTWNCDSLSLGMSFHVARKTCRSADGEAQKLHIKSSSWDNGKVLMKKMHTMAAMWKTHSDKCKIWGVGWGRTLLLNQRRTSGGTDVLVLFLDAWSNQSCVLMNHSSRMEMICWYCNETIKVLHKMEQK